MSHDHFSINDDSQIKPMSEKEKDNLNETIYIIAFVVCFIGGLFLLLVVIPSLTGK
jgi:hypothetical protein